MKVTLRQFGGIAAAIRRPAKSLDVSALPLADAAQITALVEALQAAPQRPDEAADRQPDAMSYVIQVEMPDGASQMFRATDGTMCESFSRLLDWIRRH